MKAHAFYFDGTLIAHEGVYFAFKWCPIYDDDVIGAFRSATRCPDDIMVHYNWYILKRNVKHLIGSMIENRATGQRIRLLFRRWHYRDQMKTFEEMWDKQMDGTEFGIYDAQLTLY